MGSSLSATAGFDQGQAYQDAARLTQQDYQAPRWIAPSGRIGPDRNVNGLSDGLSRSKAASRYATIGFDTNHNGRPNFLVSGIDRNLNGIPDYLEGAMGGGGIARGPVILGASVPLGAPSATIGFDTNYNG